MDDYSQVTDFEYEKNMRIHRLWRELYDEFVDAAGRPPEDAELRMLEDRLQAELKKMEPITTI
jgi:hypothetical protein